jgi:hypothetical protein
MTFLTPIAYVQLGRYEEAQALVEPYINMGFNLAQYMYAIPEFADKEQFADYARKTGLAGDYYKIRQMKRLAGEEIDKHLLGSHINAYESELGSVISFKSSGDVIYQWGDLNDKIDIYMENHMLCIQWKDLWGGLRDCAFVYKNPNGDAKNKNEYIRVTDYGLFGFRVIE